MLIDPTQTEKIGGNKQQSANTDTLFDRFYSPYPPDTPRLGAIISARTRGVAMPFSVQIERSNKRHTVKRARNSFPASLLCKPLSRACPLLRVVWLFGPATVLLE